MSGGTSRGRRRLLGRICLAAAALAIVLPGAASAERPGPGRAAPVLAPGKGELLGFSGIRPRGDLAPGTTADLITGINGNATRTVIHWQALEPERDEYDDAAFRHFEELYRGLRSGGITPVFVLQYAPVWARESGLPRLCGADDSCHYPPAASMLAEWQEFVREIARRFPAAAIEVWNEPNYRGQWQSGVDPARYARLLAAADTAAGSIDPKTLILAGGLGTATKGGWLNPGEFLGRAYRASPSLKGHADTLNLHLFPERFLGPGSALARAFASVRKARAAAGDDRTPILVSELGRTTTGPFRISEAQQAEILLHATRKILAMDDTLGVLLYTLADRDELSVDEHERGFGVGRPGPGPVSTRFDPKRAYCALREAARSPFAGCGRGPGGSARRLRARVKPRRANVEAGGRPKRFVVRVDAPRAVRRIRLVKVCIRARAKAVRVKSRDCRPVGTLRPGRTVKTSFRVGLGRHAGGKAKRLRFVATGFGAERGRTRAKLRAR